MKNKIKILFFCLIFSPLVIFGQLNTVINFGSSTPPDGNQYHTSGQVVGSAIELTSSNGAPSISIPNAVFLPDGNNIDYIQLIEFDSLTQSLTMTGFGDAFDGDVIIRTTQPVPKVGRIGLFNFQDSIDFAYPNSATSLSNVITSSRHLSFFDNAVMTWRNDTGLADISGPILLNRYQVGRYDDYPIAFAAYNTIQGSSRLDSLQIIDDAGTHVLKSSTNLIVEAEDGLQFKAGNGKYQFNPLPSGFTATFLIGIDNFGNVDTIPFEQIVGMVDTNSSPDSTVIRVQSDLGGQILHIGTPDNPVDLSFSGANQGGNQYILTDNSGGVSGGVVEFEIDESLFDLDNTNELQTISLVGDTLFLSNGNFVVFNLVTQDLNYDAFANTLSLTSSNVDLPLIQNQVSGYSSSGLTATITNSSNDFWNKGGLFCAEVDLTVTAATSNISFLNAFVNGTGASIGSCMIQIFDSSGNLDTRLFDGIVQGSDLEIDTSDLSPGTYKMKIQTGYVY